MAGWQGEGRDTIAWDGTIKAIRFIGDGSLLTNLPAGAEIDPVYSAWGKLITDMKGSTNKIFMTKNTTSIVEIGLGSSGTFLKSQGDNQDLTWGQPDHTLLSNIGTNTHAQIDTHIASAAIHFASGAIWAGLNATAASGATTSGAFYTHAASGAIHFTVSAGTGIGLSTSGSNITISSSGASTFDPNWLVSNDLRQGVAILQLQANASIPSQDYTYMYLDNFSDASGYDNTIDTASTTAAWSANKYQNSIIGGSTTESHGITLGSTSTASDYRGFKITVGGANIYLSSITKHASTSAASAHVLNSSKVVTSSGGAFSSNISTFNPPVLLSSGATYYVTILCTGTCKYGAATFPIAGTKMNWTKGLYTCNGNGTGSENDEGNDIVSISVNDGSTVSSAIVQTLSIPMAASAANYQVFSNTTTAGTGTANFDISFNSGATWETGKTFDTTYSYTGSGSILKLKLNLNGVGAGNEVTASDYAVAIWE